MSILARAARCTVLSLLALVAIPTVALAATPPVINAPSPASLKASKPVFTWTLGPAGEVLTYISVRPVVTGGNEDPQTIATPAGVLTATVLGTLDAGAYDVSARWSTAPGVSPSESGFTADQRFTVAPRVAYVRVSAPRQGNNRPEYSLNVDYDTNLPIVKVTCKVFNGRAVVSSKVLPREDANSFSQGSYARCTGKIAEALDGKRLRAEATVSFGRTKLVASKFFIAK